MKCECRVKNNLVGKLYNPKRLRQKESPKMWLSVGENEKAEKVEEVKASVQKFLFNWP